MWTSIAAAACLVLAVGAGTSIMVKTCVGCLSEVSQPILGRHFWIFALGVAGFIWLMGWLGG